MNDGSDLPHRPYTLLPGPGVYQPTPNPEFPLVVTPSFAGLASVTPFVLRHHEQFGVEDRFRRWSPVKRWQAGPYLNTHNMTRMAEPIRLQREASVAGQAGCATAIGLFLSVLGLATLVGLRSGAQGTGRNEWVLYAVGGGFALVGLVMVVLGLKMFLMARVPETIVEVDRMPAHAGESFHVTVRQPGPIRLKSLRVNLVCEQTTTRQVWRRGKRETDRDRRLIHQTNVLDRGEAAAGPGEHVVGQATVTIPADVQLADIEGRKEVTWRLEVWGRVRGWTGFGHPYVILPKVVAERDRP